VGPAASGPPHCMRLVMDLKLNVIESKGYGGFDISSTDDAVAVDDAGRMHLVHVDWNEESGPGEAPISYRSFDAKGELVERKVIARVKTRGHMRPRMSISLDPQGTVHIYYVHVTEFAEKVGENQWKLDHVQIKGKPPAKGPRQPVALAAAFSDLFKVDTAGKVTKLSKLLKREQHP